MQVSIEQFTSEVSALDNDIHSYYKEKKALGRGLISDGIINLEEYYHSPIRIMWVLKEPYCDKQGGGGGWSMTQDLNARRALGENNDSHTTWHPITYVSYGILNNFLKYEQMPKINQDSSMYLVLRKIAFINLQKLPAKTRTSNATLENLSPEEKNLVIRQINTYLPHVIIGGNTLQYLKKELQISGVDELEFGHFQKNGRLYINTFHPAQTKLSRQAYVNKIIMRAEQWRNVYSETGSNAPIK